MQALIHHMDKHYSAQFQVVYQDMCEMTHFGTSALWSSYKVTDDEPGKTSVRWSSAPTWKSDEDALRCCALLLELTDAMNSALIHLGRTLFRLMHEPTQP